MGRRATIADVAKRAGVSTPAVSQVLNHHPRARISAATRLRVEQAARDLGYHPHRGAVNLVRGRSATLGVLIADPITQDLPRLISALETSADAAHQRLLIVHARNDAGHEAQQIENLHDHRVDGIIRVGPSFPTGDASPWQDAELRQRMPCVGLAAFQPGFPVDTVTSDERAGASAAIAHLVERGHQRIAFLGAGSPHRSEDERLSGYRDALAKARVPHRAKWEINCDEDATLAAGLLTPLLQATDRPTAVLAVSDRLCLAVLDAARALSLRLGEDLALVGCAGDPLLISALRLSTVDQPLEALTRSAVACLLKRLDERAAAPRAVVVPTTLTVRDSSSRALG